MTNRQLITELIKYDMDAEIVTNVWADGETVEGVVTLVVPVSAGIAIKGDEIN